MTIDELNDTDVLGTAKMGGYYFVELKDGYHLIHTDNTVCSKVLTAFEVFTYPHTHEQH